MLPVMVGNGWGGWEVAKMSDCAACKQSKGYKYCLSILRVGRFIIDFLMMQLAPAMVRR
jgi:hypothetical protein